MTSIKEHIIKYLEAEYGNKFCWGGVLARAIHEQTGTKESVVERRARELVKSGVLEAVYDQIDGKGARCVRYRVAKVEIPIRGIVDSRTEEVVFKKADELIGQAMLFSNDVEF